jgi:serine/threonine protein kinase
VGVYVIESLLDRGGMGEVYRARDTRLGRDVALKVLPTMLAGDPERLARLEREARLLAALNHPNIAQIYGLEESNDVRAVVMELVEGETLADRLAKGALPIDHSLQIAIQIADALVAAHRAGIVHRDLKPGNIMLNKTGAKLLDFGLAKTGAAVLGPTSQSIPTATPITQPGSILGTLQYMAPEQVEGQEADPRTDIFAFGVVVYEMVTGRKAFAGTTSASLFSAILKDQPPPLSTVQPVTPAALDRSVRRCLAKDRDDRWQTARDLLEELKWIAIEGERAAPDAATRVRRRARDAELTVATALIVAILMFMAMRSLRPSAPESIVTRLDLVTPPTSDSFSFALSPDGRQVAFVAIADGTARLWVRPFDSGNARSFPGSEGASYPFWKPDGGAIGFFAQDKLMRVDVAGGMPLELTKVPGARGGTWNQDGVIVFAPQLGELMRITATGGTPVALTHPVPGQSHRWPQFLPDGRHFLFLSTLGQPSTHGVYLGSLDGREPTRLLTAETAAVYAPPGYLLRVIDRVLVAHPFNPESGVVSSESVPLAQQVGTDDATFHSAFSVSPTALAHRVAGPVRRQLVWLDRAGHVTGTVGPSDDAALANPELAPVGRRIAVTRYVQGNFDIFIVENAEEGPKSRFTFDPAIDRAAVWSPNAGGLVFSSNRNGRYDLFEKVGSGASDEKPLLATPQDKVACDWSPDGRFLLYASDDPTTGSDLWALPMIGDGKPFPVVRTSADERQGQFSPDGRWVAYVSNETGIDEVYIRPFPDAGGKKQASTNGGVDPRWGRDGRELFYVAPDGKLMAVAIHVDPDGRAVNPGPPTALFPTRLATGANITVGFLSRPQYAVAPDGRFLMNVTADDNVVSPISIVLNWATLLKK